MLKINQEANIPLFTPSWNNPAEDKFFDYKEEIDEEETHQERSSISKEGDDSRYDNENSNLESCPPPSSRKIKVIGTRHPTLTNSDIREENILPSSRKKLIP
ncbi:hypothetical protein O181_041344 [Austropuccinia psidii MF-1]|uniref:Uncharacterized protein n=1 Tax=Austropuccinia psidii MF-1 TaxID=1389203 RepID=A0A9Q3DE83_9BASI|nr:hypothetical protein [Austropuccinia psidii MF-1]